MHSTHDTCCPESVTIQISWCTTRKHYRVRGQWCPDQLMFFDDAIHDVEIHVGTPEEIRAAVVQVLRDYGALLRLSPERLGAQASIGGRSTAG